MSIKTNHFKYTKNEINLINEYCQNYYFIYLYKFNFSITTNNNQNIIDNYFNNYFNNKNYNNLSNFDKLTFNIIFVNKLVVVLNKNKVFISDCNNDYKNNFLFSILLNNCDSFIKNIYQYDNYNKYISTFNNPNIYINCNNTSYYTRKISNLKKLENYLILPSDTRCVFHIINSFIIKMNKLNIIIDEKFRGYIFNYEKNFWKTRDCIKKEYLLLYYNKLSKKITLEFVKDEDKFNKHLKKNQKDFIKAFIKFLENNFNWDFILQNVNHCYYCNKDINLIDISQLHYTFNRENKELIFNVQPIIHSKSICLPENNVIINENINKYKVINIYEKLVIKLVKEVIFYKINYYNHNLTDLLIKYNLKTPSQYKILILSYHLEYRKDYLIIFLQLRKKINNYQNNLFKIITNFLL